MAVRCGTMADAKSRDEVEHNLSSASDAVDASLDAAAVVLVHDGQDQHQHAARYRETTKLTN